MTLYHLRRVLAIYIYIYIYIYIWRIARRREESLAQKCYIYIWRIARRKGDRSESLEIVLGCPYLGNEIRFGEAPRNTVAHSPAHSQIAPKGLRAGPGLMPHFSGPMLAGAYPLAHTHGLDTISRRVSARSHIYIYICLSSLAGLGVSMSFT